MELDMGFFESLGKAITAQAEKNRARKTQEEIDAQQAEADRQELILGYRSRGIYVALIYVNNSPWQYFYYPSEEYRTEAVTDFWPKFFGAQRIRWDYCLIDPASDS